MTKFDSKSSSDVSGPVTAGEVRLRLGAILRNGWEVAWTSHARRELAKDRMTTVDAVNVLRCWRYMDPPEQDIQTREWKYRIHTDMMGIVVKFRSETQLVVITAWRK
jgi:hypothetical protein